MGFLGIGPSAALESTRFASSGTKNAAEQGARKSSAIQGERLLVKLRSPCVVNRSAAASESMDLQDLKEMTFTEHENVRMGWAFSAVEICDSRENSAARSGAELLVRRRAI
ncbi:hypothetical protein Salat_0062300 [Sesamum alatum]|uniref:Uncharacterized protein n=1 Tax=Sesamum alatum TaxID=300844 RepID=A0AAE2CX31_9LAMI|nr:hypothetical protein Salat_0062300 [Sesamum alatum]